MFTLSENHLLRVEITVKKNGILHVNRFFLLNVMEVENNNKKKRSLTYSVYTAHDQNNNNNNNNNNKNRKPKEENELDDLCPHDLLSLFA